MAWLVVGLAVAGLVIAGSFTAAFYRPGSALARLAPPEWCGVRAGDAQLDPAKPGCETVIQTPGARVFGLPNSLLGLIYYVAIIGVALTGFPPALRTWSIGAAWLTVALGIYLGYRLLRVERMSCPLCWTAHAINTLLATVLTVAYRNPP